MKCNVSVMIYTLNKNVVGYSFCQHLRITLKFIRFTSGFVCIIEGVPQMCSFVVS
jgi:hypothetical protein